MCFGKDEGYRAVVSAVGRTGAEQHVVAVDHEEAMLQH